MATIKGKKAFLAIFAFPPEASKVRKLTAMTCYTELSRYQYCHHLTRMEILRIQQFL